MERTERTWGDPRRLPEDAQFFSHQDIPSFYLDYDCIVNFILWWGWWSIGTGPEKLWVPHPRKCSRWGWMGLWTIWSSKRWDIGACTNTKTQVITRYKNQLLQEPALQRVSEWMSFLWFSLKSCSQQPARDVDGWGPHCPHAAVLAGCASPAPVPGLLELEERSSHGVRGICTGRGMFSLTFAYGKRILENFSLLLVLITLTACRENWSPFKHFFFKRLNKLPWCFFTF